MVSTNALSAADAPDISAIRVWHAPSLDVLDNLDLLGLITSGAVQGLRVTPEGALLFDAVDGPPPGLEHLVQPVLEAPQENRLQRLEEAIQGIRDDLEDRERLLDRLDAVEFALNERLGYGLVAAQEDEEAGEAAALAAWHEDGLSLKLARLEEMLAALPAALQATPPQMPPAHAAPAGPTAEQTLATIETAIATALETIPERLGELPVNTALAETLEEIASRPLPPLDLTPQRQMHAQFLQAANVMLRRIEAAIPTPQVPQNPEPAPELMAGLADLGHALNEIRARLAQLPDTIPAPPDMEAVIAAVEARVNAINLLPPPRLDMAPMRKANAQFLQATGQVLGRLEQVTEALTQAVPGMSLGPQLDMLAEEIRLLGGKITAPDVSGLEQALDTLGRRIERIEQRADPVLDLTEQRRSFAAFATALSKSLQRIEGAADRCETLPAAVARLFEDNTPPRPRDDLADAILALAQRASEPPALLPWQEELARLQHQQQAFFEDMRFLLAELAANQLRQSAQD